MKCGCILPNLVFGPDPRHDEEFEQLRSLQVTAILNLQADDEIGGGLTYAKDNAEKHGFIFCNMPITDFDQLELRRKLPACVAKLDDLLKAGHSVYLHCTAGVNRSPTVAAAYLHWCSNWSLEHAVARLESLRNCCPDVKSIQSAGRNRCQEQEAGI